MAQRWHWIRMRTTCHPTEDQERVRAALQACTGLDAEAFASVLTETELDSHHGGQVLLLDVLMERAREIRGALAVLWTPEVRAALRDEVEQRADDQGVLHWRMGKQAAFAGEMELNRGDDAVQIRLRPEVHPSSREAAVLAHLAALDES